MHPVLKQYGLLTDRDVYLFKEGTHGHLFDKLGAHPLQTDEGEGTHFAVWAPNAKEVSVVGNFNDWNDGAHPLAVRWDGSGIWEGFIPSVGAGSLYKYSLKSWNQPHPFTKGDPFAFSAEHSGGHCSRVWDLSYGWNDGEWMGQRGNRQGLGHPMAIYEVHLGSWRLPEGSEARWLDYRQLALPLARYLSEMGFTHVEFLPVMEHPFYGSWGYQTLGYFAPTSRFGTPQDFMFLVDCLHQHGIGVILDWVPSHFPTDPHGLIQFDGTHLYEHADRRQGFHPDWTSHIFNYGRHEVRSFLTSSALFWLERYHIDGLRVDAVASMLYLDYSRQEGEWIPNRHGGRENLEAISFLQQLNRLAYQSRPEIQTFAEESTAWPMVSRPTHRGGLGFGLKWNMGWMHDTLAYFSLDPVHRKHHHKQLTFSIWYSFSENFVLPLSHDEVVHGKGSLLGKMPGDPWQKFANLRLLLGYLYAHPGKKLVFMGGEIGQWSEWSHEGSLDWALLEHPNHRGVQTWVRDLNHLYRGTPALHQRDCQREGFEWVDSHDWEQSLISFLRRGEDGSQVLVICNLTPVPRHFYRIGAPRAGYWLELLNSDASTYGGSGQGNFGGIEAVPVPSHGQPASMTLTLPPLSILFLGSPRSEDPHPAPSPTMPSPPDTP